MLLPLPLAQSLAASGSYWTGYIVGKGLLLIIAAAVVYGLYRAIRAMHREYNRN